MDEFHFEAFLMVDDVKTIESKFREYSLSNEETMENSHRSNIVFHASTDFRCSVR